MTHYNSLIALKGGLEKAGKVYTEALIDGMEGLSFEIPTGAASITKDDRSCTLNVAKELGIIEPAPQCA